jgi:hypothetical protein
MKKFGWLMVIGLLLASGCIIYVPYEGTPSRESEYQEDYYYDRELDTSYFYDYLSPYGYWMSYPPHGYVWIPRNISRRWHPFIYGRWVWTDYGWTWVSYYEWGWLPFHYGRWGWDRYLGWFWVPDTVWGPAWVTWRWSDRYLGWAPIPPGVDFVFGMGIYDIPYDMPGSYWIFVEGRYFHEHYLDRYVLPYERYPQIINMTVMKTSLADRNRRVVNEGIGADELKRITKSDISGYDLRDARKPGKGTVDTKEVVIFRPNVSKNEAARPRDVMDREEVERRVIKREIKEDEEQAPSDEQPGEIRRVKKTQEDEAAPDEKKSQVKPDVVKKVSKSSAEQPSKGEKDPEVKSDKKDVKRVVDKAEVKPKDKKEEDTSERKIKKKDEPEK